MNELVPRSELSKQGWRGFGGVAGGVALLVLKGISGAGFWPGLVAGAFLLIVGLGIGSSREDRAAGAWSLARFFINLRKR